MTLLRFYIEKQYKEVVEDPGVKRQKQFDYDHLLQKKQAQKIEINIKNL